MVNAWSLAWEELNGTMDETYPIKKTYIENDGSGGIMAPVPKNLNQISSIKFVNTKRIRESEIFLIIFPQLIADIILLIKIVHRHWILFNLLGMLRLSVAVMLSSIWLGMIKKDKQNVIY